MRVALIDNYDSFTYNIVPLLYKAGSTSVRVMRNDEVDFDVVAASDAIVISPGPGLPESSGDLMRVLATFADSKPVFGICLGLQAIGEHFGGQLINLGIVIHGKATEIHLCGDDDPMHHGVSSPFSAGRYHSWVVNGKRIPDVLKVTAMDTQDVVMALRHRTLPVFGVQYHPESIMTKDGEQIMRNFIKTASHA